MSLIQTLLRRLFAKPATATGTPSLLQPEHFKAVSGGNGDSPRNVW